MSPFRYTLNYHFQEDSNPDQLCAPIVLTGFSLTRLREEPGSSARVVTLSPETTLNTSIVMHSSGRTDKAARASTFKPPTCNRGCERGPRSRKGPSPQPRLAWIRLPMTVWLARDLWKTASDPEGSNGGWQRVVSLDRRKGVTNWCT